MGYVAGKDFFHQPVAEKVKFDVGLGYGYGGYLFKRETGGKLSGENVNKSDGVESLTLRGLQHLPVSDATCMGGFADVHFAQDMSDVPHADPVPCSPPSLLENVLRLHEALFSFKSVMTSITELALGALAGDFHHFFDSTKGGLRYAFYPEMGGTAVSEKSVDYGAHADSVSMVFLRLDRDNPAGTEVLHDGKWLAVPNIPGGVVVNLGTVLSGLTGGRWQAAVHRATRASNNERMSLVMGALVPRNDLSLECLPQICGSQTEKRRKVSVKEYLDARVRLQRPEKNPADRDVVDFIDQM